MNAELHALRQRTDGLLRDYKHLVATVKEERVALLSATEHRTAVERAQSIVQTVALSVQEVAHERIAGVVTRCLESVFDDPYTFRILFERKRGRTEARLVFVRDGQEFDPMGAAGGGVIDVAAFALKVACITLQRPKVEKVLIADEPFRFVSANYRGRVRDLLLALSKDFGFQFIVVTHIPELRVGKVVEL